MSIFTKHTVETAPKGASEVLEKVVEQYQFIPNLASYVAESPVSLDAIMALSGNFDNSSLTPQEQQIVLLTVSVMNGCSYCRTVHKALGNMQKVERDVLEAVLDLRTLPDTKLNALYDFTRAIVEDKGLVSEEVVNRFLAAGYTKAQVFEVVMGVALKTFTNYSNHLAGAEPNAEFLKMAEM